MPQLGERVFVWPRPGLRVPQSPALPVVYLPSEGKTCTWSPYLERRYEAAEIYLTDPYPKAKAETPPAPSKTTKGDKDNG